MILGIFQNVIAACVGNYVGLVILRPSLSVEGIIRRHLFLNYICILHNYMYSDCV